MNIVINGDFLLKNITGVQRYAYEIVRHIDQNLDENDNFDIEILVPENSKVDFDLKKIKIVKFGKQRKFFWQQISLYRYCKKKQAICVCLCSMVPYLYADNSIGVIHDAGTLAHPEFYKKKYLLYNKIFMWNVCKRYKAIVTVSKFSKNEIMKYCNNIQKDIRVIGNAADHVLDVIEDIDILSKLQLKKNGYCYTVSSLSPNKNYKWIMEEAKNNPEEIFVISGMNLNNFTKEYMGEKSVNVIFTGYVSDSEMVTLMKYCKVFLFPTLYEGFGITPLEAMTLGTKIVVSDTPCMHEVYEESAKYINPYKCNYTINQLIEEEKTENVVSKYSWKKSSDEFIQLFYDIGEKK